jgi:hypothetical protein
VTFVKVILDLSYAVIKIQVIEVVMNAEQTQDRMNAAELMIFTQVVIFAKLIQVQKIVAHNRRIIQAAINAE